MDYYKEIKEEIVNNEIIKKVKDYSKNRSDLEAYYNIGKLLSEAGKHYGEGIIKEYSKRLKVDINKEYSVTTLKRMRQFYLVIQKGAPLVHQLTWSHYIQLLPYDTNKIIYYENEIIKNNLSKRQLKDKIKNNEYERLPEETKNDLINTKKEKIKAFIKNPIIIKNKNNYEVISEKILQKLILEDIENFMNELGTGFCFIGSEYKIKIGNKYNYIDLLLYNIKYKCYVVIELKITELKKEHIEQIQVYMNYIDKELRTINEDKTIGIIIVKKENKFIMEYCSDERIISKTYELI